MISISWQHEVLISQTVFRPDHIFVSLSSVIERFTRPHAINFLVAQVLNKLTNLLKTTSLYLLFYSHFPPRACTIKPFTAINLWISVINQSVCPWQAFLYFRCFILGQALASPTNIRLGWKGLPGKTLQLITEIYGRKFFIVQARGLESLPGTM